MENKKEENFVTKLINGPSFGISDIFPNKIMWQDIANQFDGNFIIKLTSSNEYEIHNISYYF